MALNPHAPNSSTPTPPDRADHPNRKIGKHDQPLHYTVTHNQVGMGGATTPTTQWFGDKKSAKSYGKSLAGQGYEPYVAKHDPSSPSYGKTPGTPATGMNLALDVHRFMKGH
jgi:hypothetical protein